MAGRGRTTRSSAPDPTLTASEDVAEVSTYIPPEWRGRWHRSADLGYPDYLPPRPGHDEEEMSENLVKNGFQGRSLLTSNLETFNAHSLIHDSFAKHGQIHLHMLGQLMHDVTVRQADWRPKVGASSYKLPAKVTVHDSKRDAWIADLANSQVPLSKLASSPIPHPFKGHDLLDMLFSNKIPISRAIWYVRVLGANETQMMRSRPNFKPTQYSVDWANIVTSYLKKQLGEVVLPAAYRPGLTIRQTFQGVLGDPDSRARWISRFSYTLSLLREFVAEALVDSATFLLWLAQLMSTSNLAQLGFVALLADEYLDALMKNRGFLAPFIEGCLMKMTEIDANPLRESLVDVHSSLATLIQRSFLAVPDVFVFPRLWYAHENLLRAILFEKPEQTTPMLSSEDSRTQEVLAGLRETYEDIVTRNSALTFRALPSRAAVSLRLTMVDIQLLNSIDTTTNWETFRFFENGEGQFPESFRKKLHVLLMWCVTAQCGDHKFHAAATILQRWKDRARSRRLMHRLQDFIQNELFQWLDVSEVAHDHENYLEDTAFLYGELIRRKLFSLKKFLHKLIARGETGQSSQMDPPPHFLTFLQAVPISSAFSERSAALYGVSDADNRESQNLIKLQLYYRHILPNLFENEEEGEIDQSSIPDISGMIIGERFRLTHQWLIPAVRDLLLRSENIDEFLDVKTYCALSHVLAKSRCYPSILELSAIIAERSRSRDLQDAIITTLRTHHDIWACMDSSEQVIGLVLSMQHLDGPLHHANIRSLHSFLGELRNARERGAIQFAPTPTNEVQAGTSTLAMAEVIATIRDPNIPVASMALTMKAKYEHLPNWIGYLWDNIVSYLAQVPEGNQDPFGQGEPTDRIVSLLYEIDDLVIFPLEDQFRVWLASRGRVMCGSLSSRAWELAVTLIQRLISCGTLSTKVILLELVFESWKPPSDQTADVTSSLVLAANALASRLLLIDEPVDTFSSEQLIEIQSLLGQRSVLNQPSQLISLFCSISDLIRIELREDISSAARSSSTTLRLAICNHPYFRQLALRHVDAVCDALCKPASPDPLGTVVEARLAETLKILIIAVDNTCEEINNGTGCDLPSIMTQLTPWNFSRAMVDLQLTFKQIHFGLAHESTRPKAEADLNGFTTSFLKHALQREETDMVADVLRGMNGLVAESFLKCGIERLTALLGEIPDAPGDREVESFLRKGGEILRLVASVMQPLRSPDSTVPKVPPEIKLGFLQKLQGRLSNILDEFEKMTAETSGEFVAEYRLSEKIPGLLLLLVRLLQFCLGFAASPLHSFQDITEGLFSCLLRIMTAYSCQPSINPNPTLLRALMDTASFLLSEIPKNPKLPLRDITREVKDIDEQNLPQRLSPSTRQWLVFILCYHSFDPYVDNLRHARRANTGRLVLGERVAPKPWDWTEYTGNTPPTKPSGRISNDLDAKPLNAGSLSLEHFGVKVTGEHAPDAGSSAGDRAYAELRNGADRFHSETMFERDWREGRVFPEIMDTRSNAIKAEGPEAWTSDPARSERKLDVEGGETQKRLSRHATPMASVSSSASPSAPASDGLNHKVEDDDDIAEGSSSTSTRSGKRKANRGDEGLPGKGRLVVEVVVPAPPTSAKRKATEDLSGAVMKKQGRAR